MTDTYSAPPARSTGSVPDGRSTAEIELEIQRTRARMTENVDALTWKLSPDRLKAEARHKLHETQEAVVEKVRHTAHEVGDQARQAGSGLFGTMRDNPIPSAMIGAGLAWLIVGRRRQSHELDRSAESYGGYYAPQSYTSADTAMYGPPASTVGATAGGGIHSSSDMESEGRHGMGEKASELRDRMSEKTSHARERVAETTSEARDAMRERAQAARSRASELRHDTAERARRTRGWAEQQMDENPLVMGAAVLALGAVIGSLVPTTRKEDELIGPRRDQLFDRARSSMHEAREVIGTTARETMESVKEEVGMQKETVRNAAADLSSELQTSARKVAHDAKETARSEAEQRNLM
jgi:ElaB/YqjD/DUF883 family membrane-anchored ribosome-binding protein